jgi:hypothetical protein
MVATRYVKATGVSVGTYTTKATPAKTVAQALKVADPGDTIEILDASTYAGAEIVIDKPVTITSSYCMANPTMDPTVAGFDTKVLPTIAPAATNRVIRIQGTAATRKTLGPIVLRGVRIAKGHAQHTPTDPGLGCGGGVVVIDADQVTIERCVFANNQTTAAPVTAWPEADRLALRQAILDLLGDLFPPSVETAINVVIDVANQILKWTKSSVAPIAPLSRATMITEVGKDFDGKIGSGRPNHPIAGQAFGGGLATVWASPTVSRCLFTANVANGRGGAIAVTGYGWPTIADCVVDGNRTISTGRCDGGGIGCEVSVPSKLGRDLYETGMVRFLVSKLGSVRGALASPLSVLATISPMDVINYGAWLVNPQAPNPLFRGVKALLLDAIHGQWSALTDHALYYLVTTVLSLCAWDAWETAEIAAAKTTAITVKDTKVRRNHGADDGGGLYASVLSHVALTKVEFADNVADNMGGGIRLTMGSAAVIDGCTITGNASGPGGTRGHDKGGGLAARNVDLTMTNTTVGAVSIGRTGVPGATANVSGDAPGGGLAFEASSEGAMSGIPDLWTSILVEVFGVRSVTVALGAGCVIGANGAGFSAGKAPISAAQYAKGGGLFVVRGDFPDAPTLTLTVAAGRTAIAGNRAITQNYPSRAQPGLTVTSAHEVALQDITTHREFTENTWASIIDSSGTLKF